MNPSKIDRRHLLIGAASVGIGVLAPEAATAQQVGPRLPFPPQAAGQIHGARLTEVGRTLGGASLESVDGLTRIVDELVKLRIISREDGEELKRIIEAIFGSETVDAIFERVNTIYDQLKQKTGELAIAIASIARDSVTYVRDNLKEVDLKRAVLIISADISGALTGASTGAKLGGPWVAGICAVAGAVAASATAVFDNKEAKKEAKA
jgi:hypothetical protein